MSHTSSRTQALLKEFARSTAAADIIILNKIYSSARENAADFNITGRTLFDETVKYIDSMPESEWKAENANRKKPEVFYYEEATEAADFVKAELEKPLPPEYSDGYLVITMGAGDNWKLGKML